MKALRALADEHADHADLQELLAWADDRNLDEIRNSAVHGYWWLYDIGHAHRGRIRGRRSGEQDAALMGTWDDLLQQADIIFDFAARLQAIVPWPTAILPPLDEPGFLTERVRLPKAPGLTGSVNARDSG